MPVPSRWSDIGWALLAVAVVAFSGVNALYRLWSAVASLPDWGDALAEVVVAGLWLLSVWWIGFGAWRRTRWGCPLEKDHGVCPRHGSRCARAHAGTDATGRG